MYNFNYLESGVGVSGIPTSAPAAGNKVFIDFNRFNWLNRNNWDFWES